MQTERGNNELISDLSGGVNNFSDPSKIAQNEFTLYDNLIGWGQGRFFNATKRKGFERYNTATTNSNGEIQSIIQYKNPGSAKAIDRLIVKSASTLEYINGTSFTDIVTGIGSGRVDWSVSGTNLYIAGLSTANKFYDGTNYLDVGCPPVNSSAITATGNSTGSVFEASQTYHWVVTFLYNGSQESATIGLKSDTAGVSGHASYTLSSIPTGNARVTARKIYRSLKNDTSNFYLVGILNDNAGTTFTDSTSEANLGTPIPANTFYAKNKPYISKYHTLHKERMVQGNVNDNYYNPIPTGDITLTADTGGGSLDVNATYKYRFFKMWRVALDTGRYVVVFSQFLEKSVSLGAIQNQVSIAYSGSDDWFKSVVIYRTSGNGNDFLIVPTGGGSFEHTSFPFVDGVADGSRIFNPTLEQVIPSDSRTEYTNLISWSEPGKPDLFPSQNVLEMGGTDQEITGLFSEENRIVVFKERSIYQVDTEVNDSRFWKTRKLVSHIGTPHKQAVVQLPAGGYFFFGNDSNFYLWNGYDQPVRVSDPIYSEAQAITNVNCGYDKIRNWIWSAYDVSGTAGRVLIYDLNNGKCYPFKENTTALKMGIPYQLTDGTMIFGGTNAGSLMKYGTNNQDNLNTTGTTFANVGILVKLQTRVYDTWRTVKEFLAKVWASGNGTMDIYFGIGGAEGTPTSAPITGEVTRIRKTTNTKAKEFYLRMENAENIALSFKQVGHKYEPAHTESDGF